MAQGFSRVNLAAASFPLSFTLQGRSVFLGRWDQNYVRDVNSPQDEDRDHGIAQLFYGHNVMPTGVGYQSIGYDEQISAASPSVNTFDKIFSLRDATEARYLFSPVAGLNYVYSPTTGAWTSISPLTGATNTTLVTVAYINGHTYICYAGLGVFEYDDATQTMLPVTLVGLVTANVLGICAAQGYLIVWDTTAIAWSSPVDILDFTPDVTTGAGGGNVYDIRSTIVVVLPINNGIVVYTKLNAVSGSYTGNVQLPFNFKEVAGSGGIDTPEQVSWEANLAAHYAWTSVGFQQIDKSSAKLFFPDLTDFLAGRVFEDFDELTQIFITEYLISPLSVKVTVCAERLVLVSYGKVDGVYTHVIVYDLSLKRWGKLKITHVDAFDYLAVAAGTSGTTYQNLLDIGTTYADLIAAGTTYLDLLTGAAVVGTTPKATVGFLLDTGEVITANFDWKQLTNDGVLLLGKYQFSRERLMVLLGVEVETVHAGTNFACKIVPSMDGKNFSSFVTPVSRNSSGNLRAYNTQTQAMNHSVLLTGSFYVTNVGINFTKGGVAMVGSATSNLS